MAQRLYENGYITYMRTDSTALSEQPRPTSARAQISKLYGEELPVSETRVYASKVKGAQEAHEAIRPAGDETFQTPEQVAGLVGPDEAKLYDLIWRRTIASQMADAVGVTVSARLGAEVGDGREAVFATSGRTITFPGFLKAYVQGSDDPESDADDEEKAFPPLAVGDALAVQRLEPTGHETRPPARYTEASLVQRLEELGRRTTLHLRLDHDHDPGPGLRLEEGRRPWSHLHRLRRGGPPRAAFPTTGRLQLHRRDGGRPRPDRRRRGRVRPLAHRASTSATTASRTRWRPDSTRSTPGRWDRSRSASTETGKEVVARIGRYGPYVEIGEERASIPDDLAPDELTVEKAIELIQTQNVGDKIFGSDPDSGLIVLGKTGRFGPYVQLGETEEGSKVKPKRASLFKNMSLDELSLDTALELLSLPRTVGVDPEGVEIVALNGRYGPYIQRGCGPAQPRERRAAFHAHGR